MWYWDKLGVDDGWIWSLGIRWELVLYVICAAISRFSCYYSDSKNSLESKSSTSWRHWTRSISNCCCTGCSCSARRSVGWTGIPHLPISYKPVWFIYCWKCFWSDPSIYDYFFFLLGIVYYIKDLQCIYIYTRIYSGNMADANTHHSFQSYFILSTWHNNKIFWTP